MGEDSTASSSSSSSSSGSDSDSDSDSDSSGSSSSSSTTSTVECEYVHLNKDWCPGTKKLRTIAREVADENDCPKYSKKISKEIMEQMDGMLFYRTIKNDTDDDDSSDSDSSDDDGDSSDSKSDSSDDESSVGEYGFGCFTEDDEIDVDDEDDVEEIPPKELYEALRPFYVGERFMIQEEAHCRDVYFKHPNHPGTEAFVRASQQIVIRLGVERSYDKKTYRKFIKLLYDSNFFVGKAPKCIEADEEECDRIFRARYEFDRVMIRKVLSDNMESRPIPGTVCIKCSCCAKKDPNKQTCVMKLLDCLPKAFGFPVLVVLGFFGFGFLYFGIYFIFKTLITGVYVAVGVSISFFMGGGSEEEEEVVADVERYLRTGW